MITDDKGEGDGGIGNQVQFDINDWVDLRVIARPNLGKMLRDPRIMGIMDSVTAGIFASIEERFEETITTAITTAITTVKTEFSQQITEVKQNISSQIIGSVAEALDRDTRALIGATIVHRLLALSSEEMDPANILMPFTPPLTPRAEGEEPSLEG